MPKLSDLQGFWGSGEGIGMRLGIFSGSINIESYNNALQVLAPRLALSTLRCQGRNQNANTAFDIMGASIGRACSCPSFLHTLLPPSVGCVVSFSRIQVCSVLESHLLS